MNFHSGLCESWTFLPTRILRISYNSLIKQPYLKYCILLWCFKSDKRFKLQKRAVWSITSSKYNAHIGPLLKMRSLLKIEDIMKIKAVNLCYGYNRNRLSKCFDSKLTSSNDNHSHDTRQICSVSITNKDEYWAVMYRTLCTRNTCQNTWMYDWKTNYYFIQWVSNYMKLWKLSDWKLLYLLI